MGPIAHADDPHHGYARVYFESNFSGLLSLFDNLCKEVSVSTSVRHNVSVFVSDGLNMQLLREEYEELRVIALQGPHMSRNCLSKLFFWSPCGLFDDRKYIRHIENWFVKHFDQEFGFGRDVVVQTGAVNANFQGNILESRIGVSHSPKCGGRTGQNLVPAFVRA
jgi:hypothetical protein